MNALAYVSAVFEPTVGTLAKIDSQARACADAGLPIDFYWMGSSTSIEDATFPHLRLERLTGSNAVQLRRQQARRIGELLERYPSVVLRYPLWDPVFHLLLPHKRRIVLEMHTNYLEELRTEQSWRYLSERTFGGWLRAFGGLVCVAPEILAAEVERSAYRGKTIVIPNSIDVASFAVPEGPVLPSGERPRLLMVASFFYRWHGLEKILAVLERTPHPPFELHLVGRLTAEQAARAASLHDVIVHGVLPPTDLRELYKRVHAGLTCFDLAAKGMKATTPLKTREYLASGLPIIGGFADPALPSGFPYQLVTEAFDLGAIDAFIQSVARESRRSIQRAASPFIDSRTASQQLFDFCRSL